jgi:hypothetical protein
MAVLRNVTQYLGRHFFEAVVGRIFCHDPVQDAFAIAGRVWFSLAFRHGSAGIHESLLGTFRPDYPGSAVNALAFGHHLSVFTQFHIFKLVGVGVFADDFFYDAIAVLFRFRKSETGRILFDAALFQGSLVFLTPAGFTGAKQENTGKKEDNENAFHGLKGIRFG